MIIVTSTNFQNAEIGEAEKEKIHELLHTQNLMVLATFGHLILSLVIVFLMQFIHYEPMIIASKAVQTQFLIFHAGFPIFVISALIITSLRMVKIFHSCLADKRQLSKDLEQKGIQVKWNLKIFINGFKYLY